MRDPNRPAKRLPEDEILGRVIERLRVSVKARYCDIEEWTAAQGNRIPSGTICGLTGGEMTRYPSRLNLLVRYFREVHELSYVTADYLLNGDEREAEWVKREYERREIVAGAEEPLPLFEYAEQTA